MTVLFRNAYYPSMIGVDTPRLFHERTPDARCTGRDCNIVYTVRIATMQSNHRLRNKRVGFDICEFGCKYLYSGHPFFRRWWVHALDDMASIFYLPAIGT
jgi:hypothetical protein